LKEPELIIVLLQDQIMEEAQGHRVGETGEADKFIVFNFIKEPTVYGALFI
jgi:hypothetical protein